MRNIRKDVEGEGDIHNLEGVLSFCFSSKLLAKGKPCLSWGSKMLFLYSNKTTCASIVGSAVQSESALGSPVVFVQDNQN